MRVVLVFAAVVLTGCVQGGPPGRAARATTTPNNQSADPGEPAPEVVIDPAAGGGFMVSLPDPGAGAQVEWTVTDQPAGANADLDVAPDGTVTFMPTEPGTYEITIRVTMDGDVTEVTQTIVVRPPALPFDPAQVEGAGPGIDIEDLIGIVLNQVFVASASLTETDLRNAVALFAELTVVGFDAVFGLLVEFDPDDPLAVAALETLRLVAGIDTVFPRLHEGSNVVRAEIVEPVDAAGPFDDFGANWHLERIRAPQAWEMTRGSADVLIGVSDSGFDIRHEDLAGRFAALLFEGSDPAHGNGVAGAIAARADNGLGNAGVNWFSRLIGGRDGLLGIQEILDARSQGRSAQVVNCSWAIPGLLDPSFDPADLQAAATRRRAALDRTRAYRQLTSSAAYAGRLFVWSAGNGSVDGRLHSGAIHLNDDGELDPLPNVILAAALTRDGRLFHYSNHGDTAEIAAPSGFLAPGTCTLAGAACTSNYVTAPSADDYGANAGGGLFGTSAAAAVVTGAASLVYSVNPAFSPDEVKDILIASATEFVTERFVAPDSDQTVPLARPIPILDLHAAVSLALQRSFKRVDLALSFPDLFQPSVAVDVNGLFENFHVLSATLVSESGPTATGPWTRVDSTLLGGPQATLDFDPDQPFHRVRVDARLVPASVAGTRARVFEARRMDIRTADNVTLETLLGADVSLQRLFDDAAPSIVAATQGAVSAFLAPGTYRFEGSLAGFLDAATLFVVARGVAPQPIDALFTSELIGDTGSLAGVVRDGAGNLLAGALVRISGGAQTNGFFAAATTGPDGRYQLSNVNRRDPQGQLIPTFSLSVFLDGFAEALRPDVVVLAGKEQIENFVLGPQGAVPPPVAQTGFEADDPGWTATGLWRRQDLSAGTIVNTLVPQFVSLAPDEEGPDAPLPDAFAGDFAWWFGDPATGTFVGTQAVGDFDLSGGSSTEASLSGDLTSPAIDLAGVANPVLRFATWWEIESVNPNASGFDLLDVQVSTDGGQTFETVRRLNPFVDPNDTDRAHKPFSSAGFNRKPVWVQEEIDLGAFQGSVITLRFRFDTLDSAFNGFRGWLIDALSIIDKPDPILTSR